MSLQRYTIDIAFQEPIPTSTKNRINAWILATKGILGDAATINAGQINEEAPRTKVHTCRHDEGKACDAEQDI